MSLSHQRVPSFSSFASINPSTYDVFLSFCGEDTRKGFTDHLYAAFKQKGFVVFKDDEKLEQGKSILEELFKAIKESQFAIVVISKNFASSKWCLIELNAIMECKRNNGLTVFPIFYHLDPSDVRKQKGSFAQAFTKHRKQPEIGEEQRRSWRAALELVADTAGWHVNDNAEATIVEQITARIFCELRLNSLEILKDLVGMEAQMAKLVSLLCLEMDDVRYIGICGMGGVGKTTLAKVLYNTICCEFDASCFIFGKKNNKSCSIEELQQQIIHEILKEHNKVIWNFFYGIDTLAKRLRDKKVLIALDDVNREQLEALAGSPTWFGQRSRIVLTSKDCQFWKPWVNEVYEVKLLSQNDAFQLFCRKVFNKPEPDENFAKLSIDIMRYTGGLPLAIKLIGLSLVGKGMEAWNNVCDVLETNHNVEILDKLEISYNGLEDLSKELFLDITCFFNGKHVKDIIPILEGLGCHPRFYIDDLKEKSLLEICHAKFEMHDLIQKMGQRVVHLMSLRNPGKRSRLWCPNDIIRILNNNSGTNAVEGIFLEYPLPKCQKVSFEGFSKLKMLRLLVLRTKRDYLDDKVVDSLDTLEWHGNHSKFKLSNELCVLDWWGYPLPSLPRSFQADNLFMLRLPFSCIKQLWHGGKIFEKLRYIDVQNSQYLMKTPDFSGVPNIEELDLSFCTSLSKVCSSIRNLKRLIYLSLQGCKSLEKLPKEISLESLKGLDLFGCSRLKKFPETLNNMTSLQVLGLDRTTMEKLRSSFFNLSSLKCLAISRDGYLKSVKMFNGDAGLCTNLSRLYNDPHPHTFSFSNWSIGLGSLISLDLSYLDLLDGALPRDISSLSSLKSLDISWNRFTKIPQCVSQLPNLEDLNLSSYQLLQSLSMPLPSKLSSQSYPIERIINLENCNLLEGAIPDDLGYLSLANTLSLGSNKFTKLPKSFCQISNLEWLFLEDCQWLQALPELPLSLCSLDIRNSPSLEIYDCHTDEWTRNSRIEPWTSVWFSATTNSGYDDIPYKILQVLLGCPLLEGSLS